MLLQFCNTAQRGIACSIQLRTNYRCWFVSSFVLTPEALVAADSDPAVLTAALCPGRLKPLTAALGPGRLKSLARAPDPKLNDPIIPVAEPRMVSMSLSAIDTYGSWGSFGRSWSRIAGIRGRPALRSSRSPSPSPSLPGRPA